MSITYKDAGVDIEKGDALVEKIKLKVKSTYGDRVPSRKAKFPCSGPAALPRKSR